MAGEKPETYRLCLQPHRSLSPKGFAAILMFVAGISFLAGLAFFLMGAWPVAGFFGLDALAIYIAFRLNFRNARWQELIEISGPNLNVQRISPKGQQTNWHFNPYWVRVATRFEEDDCMELALTSHGKRLVIGSFLAPQLRERAANSLKQALAASRA